jgi:hypothetical protein
MFFCFHQTNSKTIAYVDVAVLDGGGKNPKFQQPNPCSIHNGYLFI